MRLLNHHDRTPPFFQEGLTRPWKRGREVLASPGFLLGTIAWKPVALLFLPFPRILLPPLAPPNSFPSIPTRSCAGRKREDGMMERKRGGGKETGRGADTANATSPQQNRMSRLGATLPFWLSSTVFVYPPGVDQFHREPCAHRAKCTCAHEESRKCDLCYPPRNILSSPLGEHREREGEEAFFIWQAG